jgi:chemotaxis response regulator CheB
VRIALVNDLALALRSLQRVLELEPAHRIAWIARDGEEAVERTASDRPDLILMDLLMPRLNGVEATRRIMAASPCPILVVTGSVGARPGLVYEALGCGAIDAISLPSLEGSAADAGAALLKRIRQIERLVQPSPGRPSPARPARATGLRSLPPLIAIGASTGGPHALAACLAPLPLDLAAAVVVAQHIDAQFSPGLASWLDQQIALPVRLAEAGERPQAGVVLLAGRNDHLVLQADGRLAYNPEPRDEPYRPSVNRLFHSLLQPGLPPGQAVLLTGMGRDGAAGLLELRQGGWHTIAQSEDTCAVYGMPRAAVELGGACEQLPPSAIALSLLQRLRHR